MLNRTQPTPRKWRYNQYRYHRLHKWIPQGYIPDFPRRRSRKPLAISFNRSIQLTYLPRTNKAANSYTSPTSPSKQVSKLVVPAFCSKALEKQSTIYSSLIPIPSHPSSAAMALAKCSIANRTFYTIVRYWTFYI